MKFRVIFASLLIAGCAIAQNPDDSTIYLSFFQEAAHRPEVAPGQPLSVNGDGLPVTYAEPTMEDTLGITSDDAHSLVQIALLCESDMKNLDASMRALVFESRLQLADSNKTSEAVAAQLKELEAKRVQMVQARVQQLKASLGDRFKIVDDYVRTHASSGFFPVAGPKKKL